MKETVAFVPELIQIGSTGRNSGKTTVAKILIDTFKKEYPLIGLKIITITGKKGVCQRGGTGCGICTSINEGYELLEETHTKGIKDTQQLLSSGCKKVYLLKAFEDHLLEGFQAFIKQVPKGHAIICESNSLRRHIQPGLFLMMNNKKTKMKKTAAEVFDLADYVLKDATDEQLKGIQIETVLDRLIWKMETPSVFCIDE